mgnify:FL=1
MWLFDIFRGRRRQLVINHLTRMEPGRICVAGLDPATGQHRRLVLPHQHLKTDTLARYGGPFDIGHVVVCRHGRPKPRPPHVEDYLIPLSQITLQGVVEPAHYWDLLKQVSKTSLREIFGPDLKRLGAASYGTTAGQGQASLGCLRLRKRPELSLGGRPEYPQVRLRFTDGELQVEAPVNDLRLYGENHYSPLPQQLAAAQERLRTSRGVILSLGLTRAFAATPEQLPVHWLQVNNLHCQEQPLWRLG